MQLAGMTTWQDAIGNVHGELRGANSSGSALMLGSHYDTVKDAGAFDGPLGIITSIAAVKALVATTPQCMPRLVSISGHASRNRRGNSSARTANSWQDSSIFSFLKTVVTGARGEVATGAKGSHGEQGGGDGVQHTAALQDMRPCIAAFRAGPGRGTHVRVVAFTDEEGLRFQSTFLGSRALAGASSLLSSA